MPLNHYRTKKLWINTAAVIYILLVLWIMDEEEGWVDRHTWADKWWVQYVNVWYLSFKVDDNDGYETKSWYEYLSQCFNTVLLQKWCFITEMMWNSDAFPQCTHAKSMRLNKFCRWHNMIGLIVTTKIKAYQLQAYTVLSLCNHI